MSSTPPPARRPLLPETAGGEAPAPARPEARPDPLAGALPGWDLLPATGFLRRR